MPDINREDLKIILLFGIHIAKIDGDFDVWERRILARMADAMKLSEEERKSLLGERVSLAHGLRDLSSPAARSLLLKVLCAVSHADGSAHDAELEFIAKVIDKLGSQVFVLSRSEWGVYEDEVFQTLAEVS